MPYVKTEKGRKCPRCEKVKREWYVGPTKTDKVCADCSRKASAAKRERQRAAKGLEIKVTPKVAKKTKAVSKPRKPKVKTTVVRPDQIDAAIEVIKRSGDSDPVIVEVPEEAQAS
jgi:hypothetical protein